MPPPGGVGRLTCRPCSAPAASGSNKGDPREPAHVHVERDGTEAKFWITPEVRVAYNDGFNARTLRELTMMVEANRDRIEEAWHGFFG